MSAPTDAFKARLSNGEVLRGIFAALVDPVAAEIVAGAGFDWMMIDMEHAPNDVRTVLAQLQATAASPTAVAVRPPDHDPVTIKRLLDVGVVNFVIPMVESAEDAAAIVRAVRYPPRGIRGVGPSMARAAQWNRTADYLTTADEQIAVICQVESVKGIHAARDIAAVDGVDAVFIGPSDLAASMGHIGQPGHPDVVDAVSTCINGVRADANAAIGYFASTPTAERSAVDAGATLLALGSDIAVFVAALGRLVQPPT